MANEQNNQHKLEFELSPEVAQGQYANLAIIAHSASEFILDFAAMLPGLQKAKVKSRIVTTPEHAKKLMLSLQENIARRRTSRQMAIPLPSQQPHIRICGKGLITISAMIMHLSFR